MGQVCSTDRVLNQISLVRDPEDEEYDPIAFGKTNLENYDVFFNKASAPLLDLWELHNSLARKKEKVLEMASMVENSMAILLTVNNTEFDNDIIEMNFYYIEEDIKKGANVLMDANVLKNILDKQPELNQMYQRTKQVLSNLNGSIVNTRAEETSKWMIVDNKIKLMESGKNDKAISEFNIMLFKLKKELEKSANVQSLAQAVQICLREMKHPQITINIDANGCIHFMDQTQANKEVHLATFSDLTSRRGRFLRDAIVEVQEQIERVVSDLPKITDKVGTFSSESKEIPKKVAETAIPLGKSAYEIRMAETNASENVRQLAQGPEMVKATKALIQQIGKEFSEAFNVPIGA